MGRWLRSLWVASAAAASACALGCASAAAPPERPDLSPPSPLLWRARGPEPGDGELLLLGSVHLGDRRMQDLGPAVERGYGRSDELVVEVDLSGTDPEEAARLAREYGMLPPGRSLRDLLSEQGYALLVAYGAERGIELGFLERLEPWLATATLAVMEMEAAGYQGEYGVDRLFLGRAQGAKPIVALETLESQLEMLDGLPDRIQELMLMDLLARGSRMREEAIGLVEAWEGGDEAALVALLFGPATEHPELEVFYERVFYERNRAMCDRLMELARDGKTRFAVLGAGHMVGPRGIPALLASRGFRVEQIGGAGGSGELR